MTTMHFTTANTMVKLKLRRNEQIINLLNIETKIAKLEMLMRYRLVTHNTTYVTRLQEINDIERQQLNIYDLSREHNIKVLTTNLNNFDIELDTLKKDILDLKYKFIDILALVNDINSTIPEGGIITNFTF